MPGRRRPRAASDLGEDPREAQAAANRPLFLGPLGREIPPGIAEILDTLAEGGKDAGCGLGWSSIGIAESYPSVAVDGFDLDGPSVEAASQIAADRGLTDRVRLAVEHDFFRFYRLHQ